VLLAELDVAALQAADEGSDAAASHRSSRTVAVGLFGAVGVCSTSTVTDRVVQVVAQLLSVLVYAPSLNDEDAFYFVTALRKAVLERLAWVPSGSSSASQRLEAGVARVRILLLLAQLYALWGQKTLPDRLDGVDSNDVLYGGDDLFWNEVQARFSSTVEDVAREIEALGDAGENSEDAGDSAAERLVAAQIELMLDLVNLVVPVLEYDEAQALTATDSFRAEELGAGRSGGRRRKKPRSGAALVRKCMAYSHDKAQSLRQTKPQDASTRQVQMATWTCRYFDSTRAYVAEFLQSMCKRAAGARMDADSQHAVQALAEALATLQL